MNPFEHVKNLHTKQRRWEDFNDEEKKSFNVFIINKTLSFNPDYLSIVNMVQNYTGLNQILSQKEVFNLYFNLLPTKFRFYMIHKFQLKFDSYLCSFVVVGDCSFL